MAQSTNQPKTDASNIAEQRKLVMKSLRGGWSHEMNWLSVEQKPHSAASQPAAGETTRDLLERSR